MPINLSLTLALADDPRGRVHCSAESAALLELQVPEMPLASRGEIDVKVSNGRTRGHQSVA